LEFFLNPAIPAGMMPPPPPPKSKVEKEKKKPAKGKSVVTSTASKPSSSRSSPTKSQSLPSKSEKKPEKNKKKDMKKFSSPSQLKDKKDTKKFSSPSKSKPSPKVNKGRVVKSKNVPLDSLSFTKALHLAGRISRGEIVGTPTLLQDKLVQLALMQFESMKTFTKVKLTAGEDVPMVALPSLAKPSPASSTVVKPSSHGEEDMEVEVVAAVLPAPAVAKDTVIASAPSTSGQTSAKVKPIVDDLTDMLNPIRVQSSKAVAFDKLSTIQEVDDPMDTQEGLPTAQDAGLLDHQEDEDLLTYDEEDLKLLEHAPDENDEKDENKSEDDHFDP